MLINMQSHIGSFANCTALRLQDSDDAGLADALPRQAQHKGVELRTGQGQRACNILGPD